MPNAQSPGGLSCTLVKQIITDWAKSRDRDPFPYRQVGEHLTQCLSCLSWSTEIAYQPGDHYLRSLRLRLGEVLYLLGRSLLAAWSAQEAVKIRFHVEPEDPGLARRKALKFLKRYEGFSPNTKDEAGHLREMVNHAEPGSLLTQLEPYELVRHFFQTALEASTEIQNPKSKIQNPGERLDLLVYLGITENYQACAEQNAGHHERATDHFEQARSYLTRVTARDVHPYRGAAGGRRQAAGGLPSDSLDSDRTALISARINLATTEVLQGRYSEVSLHNAIAQLYEAKRLVPELGLRESDYPNVVDNLLIGYLRLYLDHHVAGAYEQARQLAAEICATPELGPLFLKEFIRNSADPELTQLLKSPSVAELADWLNQQTALSHQV